MTDALFLDPELADPLPGIGEIIRLGGPEGRHAAVVRRLRIDESLMISDGRGRGIRGRIQTVEGDGLVVSVTDQLLPEPPDLRVIAVQALAKGDRSELAVEMLTETGVEEIVPWQSARSVVRWQGERGDRARGKWQSAAREATKQSRRLRVPMVAEPVDLAGVVEVVRRVDLALILHEEATQAIADVDLPTTGTVAMIIGPEGGIDGIELDRLVSAGGRPVTISDGVLRTSTAGVAAMSMITLLAGRR